MDELSNCKNSNWFMARKQQQQQDETRYCEHCGISYIWTVEEQRWQHERNVVFDTGNVTAQEEESEAGNEMQLNHREEEAALHSPLTLSTEPPHYCPGCRYLLPTAGRERGLVKWYNRRKGYGFLVRSTGPEIYVNRNALRRGHLRPDELVEFTVDENQQGPVATQVTVLPME